MDDLDEKMLAALREDARMSITTLAGRLDVARTTAQARLERLERTGVIAGYTVRMGDTTTNVRIRATVLLALDPRAGPLIVNRLRVMPQVEKAMTSSGRFDLILQVSAQTTAQLDAVLDEIGGFDGVRSSESLIHLSQKIDR